MEEEKNRTIEQEGMERLAGKFTNSDNREPHFIEELSDGGERNEMAEKQLKRMKMD